jgi:hypothetical protein
MDSPAEWGDVYLESGDERISLSSILRAVWASVSAPAPGERNRS